MKGVQLLIPIQMQRLTVMANIIHVITDGLSDNLPYDTGYSTSAVTFTTNNLVFSPFTIEDNDDTLHDNTNKSDGQQSDSNGQQYLAGTTTYIASEARAVVTNNTTGESGSVHIIKISGDAKYYYAPTIEINNGDSITWKEKQTLHHKFQNSQWVKHFIATC